MKNSSFNSANSIRLISLMVIWNLFETFSNSSSLMPNMAAVSFPPRETFVGSTIILSPTTFPMISFFTALSSTNSVEIVDECKIPASLIESSSLNSTNCAITKSFSSTEGAEFIFPYRRRRSSICLSTKSLSTLIFT